VGRGSRNQEADRGPGVTRGRRAAAEILRAVSRGRRLDRALDAAVSNLPDRERRWAQEAAYGTIRLRGRLDHLLDLHLRKGLSSLSPLLLDLLRLGAYQLLYMDGVPSYAAVSQTVQQVRSLAGKGGAPLANGVLRSLEREGGDPDRFPPFETSPLEHLTTWGSHPPWLLRRWLGRWSPDQVRRLVELNNAPAPVHFRPLGVEPGEARDRLREMGWEARLLGDGIPCLLLGSGTDPALLLQEVSGIVQDPGAALVTLYAHPQAGIRVADLCAAPGGKALALAHQGAYVLAADPSLPRLRVLRENVERVGGRVWVVAARAQEPPLGECPMVLLDVPCSGTGTLRRHPDARWRLTPETLRELVDLQERILEGAAPLVPAGGHLVYATCTLEEEENEGQVRTFLARHPEFHLKETGAVPARYLDEMKRLRVLPQETGFDGAFAARLERGS